MKVFRRISAAKAASEGAPYLGIRDGRSNFYLTGITSSTEITVITSEGYIGGNIIAGHLDRLGNGNWAYCADDRGAGRHVRRAWQSAGLIEKDVAPLFAAIVAAERFVRGFEGDELQNAAPLLAQLREQIDKRGRTNAPAPAITANGPLATSEVRNG